MTESTYVLIVSSDLDFLQTLSQALAIDGFRAKTATNWVQALTITSNTPPALILYEVREMDEAVRGDLLALRKANSEVPVLLLSSLDSAELSETEQAGLIAASIMKPLHLGSLEECLERLGVRRQASTASCS
jgi:DNA-binding NtrC family response regulator